MAYTVGDSKQIIVGAAALFIKDTGAFDAGTMPAFVEGDSYADTLSDAAAVTAGIRNVGFTNNGLEMQFAPDFGEVQVDQLLDSAKLFKQGMRVTLNTAFAEATLENLLVAVAGPTGDLTEGKSGGPGTVGTTSDTTTLNLSAGKLGDCPIERGLIAVGPGTGDCTTANGKERIYLAYRALSMDNVTVSAKRDSASVFEVSFRLLPDSNGSYGKLVDRVIKTTP